MKIDKEFLEFIRKESATGKKEYASFFRMLSLRDGSKVDAAFHRLHETVFAETDCLSCANCCRTLGPRITGADVRRVSAAMKIRPAELTEKYLRVDEDGDYVFRTMPCPFLDEDNYCRIYDDRPRACRDYPHTDRRRMQQILPLTLKNMACCPAVFEIVRRMKTEQTKR
jgi:uncharacterized protein